MPTVWTDSFTHGVAVHGEHPSPGEGGLGETEWSAVTTPFTTWLDNHTHDVGAFGAFGDAPPGEGAFGPTDWGVFAPHGVSPGEIPPVVPPVVVVDDDVVDVNGYGNLGYGADEYGL